MRQHITMALVVTTLSALTVYAFVSLAIQATVDALTLPFELANQIVA